MTITVYVSIGNSDDKLTQARWASFYSLVSWAVHRHAAQVHGQWVSEPTSAFRNACWCFGIHQMDRGILRAQLTEIRTNFGQDSVAWAEVPSTEFI